MNETWTMVVKSKVLNFNIAQLLILMMKKYMRVWYTYEAAHKSVLDR